MQFFVNFQTDSTICVCQVNSKILSFTSQGLRYSASMEKVAGLTWAIAKIVKECRESRRLTQGQLAGFAGLSEIFIAKLEQGACGGSLNAFVQIAIALEISPSVLMKKVETEWANRPSKPESIRGRPSQPAKQARKFTLANNGKP